MYQWYTQKPDNSAGVSGVSTNERTDAANISPTPPVIIWLGFSDFVDLWVIKIFFKRSREQSTKLKRRSRSESLRKVCLFHYPSERLNLVPRALRVSSVEGPGDEVVKDFMMIKNGRKLEIHQVRKGTWTFFLLIVIFGCWLAEEVNCDHVTTSHSSLHSYPFP